MHPQTPSLRPLPLSDPGVMEWLDRLVIFPDDVANKIHNRITTTDIAVRRFPPGYQLYEKKRSGKRGLVTSTSTAALVVVGLGVPAAFAVALAPPRRRKGGSLSLRSLWEW